MQTRHPPLEHLLESLRDSNGLRFNHGGGTDIYTQHRVCKLFSPSSSKPPSTWQVCKHRTPRFCSQTPAAAVLDAKAVAAIHTARRYLAARELGFLNWWSTQLSGVESLLFREEIMHHFSSGYLIASYSNGVYVSISPKTIYLCQIVNTSSG